MKKQTLKDDLKKIENDLKKDEGAWLKSLGELGDLARILLAQQAEIETLKQRLKLHEEGKA